MRKGVLILLILFNVQSAFAQDKLVIDDETGLILPLSGLLNNQLKESNLEIVSVVDFNKICDYTFVKFAFDGDEIVVEMTLCKKVQVGTKKMSRTFLSMSDDERVIIVKYTILDIYENKEPLLKQNMHEKKGGNANEELSENKELEEDTVLIKYRNEHNTRYFYTPTAFNLKRGELYYNTLYYLIHDAQYGFTDNFSLGMGTTIIGFPFYVTPKATIFSKGLNTLALGDIFMIGTWGSDFTGNILYGVYTYGNQFNNISIGFGSFFLKWNDRDPNSHMPMGNVSLMLKLSNYFYFTTENYLTGFSKLENEFEEKDSFVFAGITGFRFINKQKDIESYQVGLAYFKLGSLNSALNDNDYGGGIMIPVVGFTRKFGQKY